MKFTQYLFPHGRQEEVTIDMSPEVEALAKELEAKGCRFEIENNNGMIFMDCLRDDGCELTNQLCENGPKVPICVEKLVREATTALANGTTVYDPDPPEEEEHERPEA
jgi:hypothetical protein